MASLKLTALFKEAKRLNLDPNKKWSPKNVPEHMGWNNTPLHLYLGNERFELAKTFLSLASEHQITIDLDSQDREGKTPLMLAIKMGNVPADLIKSLISNTNYNQPDNSGVTPIMMACASRRIDIVKLLLDQHNKKQGLKITDLSYLSDEQKLQLTPFINQTHPETGKSLLHYAVLRAGTEEDLKRSSSYQQTVANIIKSTGIDPRRDINAKHNAAINDSKAQVVLSQEEIDFYNKMKKMGLLTTQKIDLRALKLTSDVTQLGMVFTDLSYRDNDKVANALLACKQNAFLLASKTLSDNKQYYTKIHEQINSYAGVSCTEAILRRTEEMMNFLISIGTNCTLKQKQGNKTPLEYLKNLELKENQFAITKEDQNYILPCIKKMEKNNPSDNLLKTQDIKY